MAAAASTTTTTTTTFHPNPKSTRLTSITNLSSASFRPTQFPLISSSSLTFSNNLSFCSSSSHHQTLATDDQKEAFTDESQPQPEVTEDTATDDTRPEESPASILASLQSYKQAVADNDQSKIFEIETYLKSVEDDKLVLETQLATLSDEFLNARDQVLRISADFDNFRKRTESERVSLVANAQGEVVESLLPVLDNFERAKAGIKADTEKEETINNSYQSIFKQFGEILGSLGVVPVETTGQPFDPLANPRVGSKFSRVFDDLFQRLSGFIKK